MQKFSRIINNDIQFIYPYKTACGTYKYKGYVNLKGNPSDFYNDQEQTLKNGVVGNYVMNNTNGESQIVSATILGRDDKGNYIVITQNGLQAHIDESQFHPLYLSEIRTINGVTYYYNSYGLYTINKEGKPILLKD